MPRLLQAVHSPLGYFQSHSRTHFAFLVPAKHLWALTNSYHRSVHLTISWETFRGVAWGMWEGAERGGGEWKDGELHGNILGFGPSSFLLGMDSPQYGTGDSLYIYLYIYYKSSQQRLKN